MTRHMMPAVILLSVSPLFVCCVCCSKPDGPCAVTLNESSIASFLQQIRYDTIRLTFIGDIMQHGPQIRSAAAIAGKNGPGKGTFDYSAMFRHIQPWLDKADIAVANIEFPSGTDGYRGYPLFKGPSAVAVEARRCGIDLALMANNHIADDGSAGIANTLDLYDSLAIVHTGAFRNLAERERDYPLIMNSRPFSRFFKSLRFAFLNFTYSTNGNAVPEPYIVNSMDSIQVKEDLEKVVANGADYIFVLPHWGIEYNLHPSLEQKYWADMLLRSRADAIIGTHPHVPQDGIIFENNDGNIRKIVFHSLGNYISNQNEPLYTRTELMVTLRIQADAFTGKSQMMEPQWEWLWCFKPGEFEEDYTVVPLSLLLSLSNEERSKHERVISRLEKMDDMRLIRHNRIKDVQKCRPMQ